MKSLSIIINSTFYMKFPAPQEKQRIGKRKHRRRKSANVPNKLVIYEKSKSRT